MFINKFPRGRIDNFLLFITLCLVALGIAMVYSSSNMIAYEKYNGDGLHFLKTQLVAGAIGLLGLAIAASKYLPYEYYRRWSIPLLFLGALLLLSAYSPLGHNIGSFKRWIKIYKMQFQPVEFAKLTLIIYVARFLSQNGDKIRRMRYVLLSVSALLIFFLLIFFQPDFGTAVLISTVVFLMLFAGGARLSQIIILGLIAAVFLYLAIHSNEYRLQRWEAFWNNSKDVPEQVKNYQLWQSKNALAAGGILGVGVGNSVYKLFYLPYPHTDFIFSIIGEELGFIGTVVVIALFMALAWRGFYIALHVKDTFGSMLATGISILFGLQTIVNIGVVVGIFPTKGLTLPFISCGGSSLMMSLITMGILLNVSREVEE
ncbi:TPA: putative lipid II flippase FtsW [Candidatus Poribacteria bacterium]|nr:putative lipid II flippase FtsW [Candidatus Poribacteria bacterium]